MPIYEYVCPDCDFKFEILRPFSKAGEVASCTVASKALDGYYPLLLASPRMTMDELLPWGETPVLAAALLTALLVVCN